MSVNISKVRDPRFWKKWHNSGAVLFNQQHHPERMPGEVWITNADHNNVGNVGWKTKRKGVIAYDKYGRPLGNSWRNSFPVFAQKSELDRAGVSIT